MHALSTSPDHLFRAVTAIVVAAATLDAPRARGDSDLPAPRDGKRIHASPAAFTFVRIIYDSVGGEGEAYYFFEGRLWWRWETDYPEAESNLMFRLRQLTTIAANPKPLAMRLTDPRLFDHPFIYMSDVGWQELNDDETEALRLYLLGGGFLWVDDFWGNAEWNNFEFNMARAFPEHRWRTIPQDHPILQMVFPIEACPQIPAKTFAFAEPGQHWDPPFIHRGAGWDVSQVNNVNFRGLFHDDGRLMAIATHNTDIGDGWEREAEGELFFQVYSVRSYAFAINVLAYVLTH